MMTLASISNAKISCFCWSVTELRIRENSIIVLPVSNSRAWRASILGHTAHYSVSWSENLDFRLPQTSIEIESGHPSHPGHVYPDHLGFTIYLGLLIMWAVIDNVDAKLCITAPYILRESYPLLWIATVAQPIYQFVDMHKLETLITFCRFNVGRTTPTNCTQVILLYMLFEVISVWCRRYLDSHTH